jgi:hypothetical protein
MRRREFIAGLGGAVAAAAGRTGATGCDARGRRIGQMSGPLSHV